MGNSEQLPPLLTIEEAASYIRIHPESLRRKCKEGVGPAIVRNGKTVRIRRERLLEWVRRYEQGAP